jgi:hypothetical protein
MNGEEHVAFLVGVDVVFDTGGEHENAASGEGVLLVGGADGEAAFEDVNGDGAIGEVLGHRRALGKVEERDRGVTVADEGLLPMALRRGSGLAGQIRGGGAKVDQLLRGGKPL